MKKIIALVLALVLVVALLAACGEKKDETPADVTDAPASEAATVAVDPDSDYGYILSKGTLVVGITDFAPMDFKDDNGDWIGFDADLAKAFGEYIGVTVEFSEITWSKKILELDGKNIDCVWNGMTLTDEVMNAMSTSVAYCRNEQVVIVKADVADQYTTAEACKDLKFAVEQGSAGKDMAEEFGYNYTEFKDQATALMEVAAGTCDAAIVDSSMAKAMVGAGTDYENLVQVVVLNSEEYGVGFRKGSNLVDLFNDFYAAALADGTVDEIADLYGISGMIIK